MSRKQHEINKRRLAGESGVEASSWGGRLSVALVYPNTYHQGMSNLGFQAVYRLLNQRDDTLCERFFLPDREVLDELQRGGGTLVSLESGRALSDFDLIAFSISFENDYLNLPVILELGRLPLFREERDQRHPLLLCGGVCAFLNPEPLAEIMDLFAVGEAEVLLDRLIDTLTGAGELERNALLRRLADLPGIYVPSLYRVEYHADGRVAAYHPLDGVLPRVARQWLPDLTGLPTGSALLSEETEFGDMYLAEVSRGCSRGCRFCAAGYIYLPERQRDLPTLQRQVAAGLEQRGKIGLVGAAVSDYPQIAELNRCILEAGGAISVASLRIDALDRAEAEALLASGHKTVALAPEAGSQQMRDLINKGLDEAQILAAVRLLAEVGIPNLKLYFLIGLPTETPEDVEAIITLAVAIRDLWREAGRARGRIGQVTLSVNPFIPKPFTPLQWAGMEPLPSLKKKVALLRKALARQPHLELQVESLRSAVLQAVLSRGDRRLGRVLPLLARGTGLARACREVNLEDSFYSERERDQEEVFPWEIIDSGVRRSYLYQEYLRARRGLLTGRCHSGCRRCGICC